MGHFRGAKDANSWQKPPLWLSHSKLECPFCQCAKLWDKNSGQFWEFILWTLKTEKCRKFGKKIAKNSGRSPAWPVSEFKLSYRSRIAWYKNCPPIPLGGGKIGGDIFKFDQKFLEKGGSPTPQILHRWNALMEHYNACQLGVSRPRNKKMPAFRKVCPVGSICEFIEKRQL